MTFKDYVDLENTLQNIANDIPVSVYHGSQNHYDKTIPPYKYVSISFKQACRYPYIARGMEQFEPTYIYEGKLIIPDHLMVYKQALEFLTRIQNKEPLQQLKQEWDSGLREVQLDRPLKIIKIHNNGL